MKRLIPFVLLICAVPAFAQLNIWRWQNPLPVGNYLRAVQMISKDVIYVCGDNCSFMRSSDGGVSWDIQGNVLSSKANLYALSFLNKDLGMCCGDSGTVMKTTDGGNSWQSLGTQTKNKLNSIVVVDANIAVMITAGGAIMRTTNGGTSWITIPVEGNRALYSITMLRPDFLTITGYAGVLLKSTDKGQTWPPIPLKIGNSFYNAHFSDDNTGTMIGEYGMILRTTDGGTSWTPQNLSDGSIITATLNIIDSKDPNIFAIAGDYATMLYTNDAGITWKRCFLEGTAAHIKGLSFFDALTGTAVGSNGTVLHTSDGGATWAFLPHKPYTEIFHGVAFPKGDTSLGIAVGNAGTILRTSDGGKNWGLIESGFNHILYSVGFLTKTTVIAVGEYGTILKSEDAGLTWAAQSSGTSHPLYAVSFPTPTTGIAVGDSGVILQTFSAGLFWTRRYTTPVTYSDYFKGVTTPDSTHAFICGGSSIFKSTDGGVSWSTVRGALDSRGISISFADSLHGGYVYTDKMGMGYIRSTSNGGITFDSVYPSGITGGLNGICFSDKQHATVVGTAGYIGHTTNGGGNWVPQLSNTLNTLNAVAFGTVKAGTAVGYRGNIMRITTNEKTASVEPQGANEGSKILIAPNYPNPFSLSTTISYNLRHSGFTAVEIFSIGGKLIATLANEFQVMGDHSLQFDAHDLASGTYFIRIQSGGMSASGEMIIRH